MEARNPTPPSMSVSVPCRYQGINALTVTNGVMVRQLRHRQTKGAATVAMPAATAPHLDFILITSGPPLTCMGISRRLIHNGDRVHNPRYARGCKSDRLGRLAL
jgi:hypothetical protein